MCLLLNLSPNYKKKRSWFCKDVVVLSEIGEKVRVCRDTDRDCRKHLRIPQFQA